MNFKLSTYPVKRTTLSLFLALFFTTLFSVVFILPTLSKYQTGGLAWQGVAMYLTTLVLCFIAFVTQWEERKKISTGLASMLMVFTLIAIFRGDLMTGDVGLENLKADRAKVGSSASNGEQASGRYVQLVPSFRKELTVSDKFFPGSDFAGNGATGTIAKP